MPEITDVEAWEVLDSRGNPTVRSRVETADGSGTFTVPSGASTGSHEAVEARDGGDRFAGRGVRGTVAAVREELGSVVVGREATEQAAIDDALVAADGTENLSVYGANAVLAMSGAVARAAADDLGTPLYEYLAPGTAGSLPRPMVNVISGGLHAHGGMEIQDFLIIPVSAETYNEAIETSWAVRHAVKARITDRGSRPLVADEGGFSPPLDSITDAFELIEAGIRDVGHKPAIDDVAFAVDVAATHFYNDESSRYEIETEDESLDRDRMIDRLLEWIDAYPIISLEDPLDENDWQGWSQLAGQVPDHVQLLGDDLIATNRSRLDRAIEAGTASAVLVKMNQAGTITRTIDVIEHARDSGLATVVSARSGETCDSTMADLAVAYNAEQLKIGSLARSERLAKYNRLLEIAREHTRELPTFGFDRSP